MPKSKAHAVGLALSRLAGWWLGLGSACCGGVGSAYKPALRMRKEELERADS